MPTLTALLNVHSPPLEDTYLQTLACQLLWDHISASFQVSHTEYILAPSGHLKVFVCVCVVLEGKRRASPILGKKCCSADDIVLLILTLATLITDKLSTLCPNSLPLASAEGLLYVCALWGLHGRNPRVPACG